MTRRTEAVTRAVVVLLLAVTSACGGADPSPAGPSDGISGSSLVGLFSVSAGGCAGGKPTGSYFRMLQPNGTPNSGPFVENGDSTCSDKTTTPLTPGGDGGLLSGGFQREPSPSFDASGNGLAGQIVKPQKWFAVAFGIATNPKDPQTGRATTPPRLEWVDGRLSGDLSSFAASWNGQVFNQGAPKPGGGRPGNTAGPTGTYDPTTKAYTLEWSSQIEGGPFDNFTGIWHLEGTFSPTG